MRLVAALGAGDVAWLACAHIHQVKAVVGFQPSQEARVFSLSMLLQARLGGPRQNETLHIWGPPELQAQVFGAVR